MEEEMDEYNKAMKNSNGVMDSVHNQACLETNLSKQSILVTGPILDSIRAWEKSLEIDIKQLQEMKVSLLERLQSMKWQVMCFCICDMLSEKSKIRESVDVWHLRLILISEILSL